MKHGIGTKRGGQAPVGVDIGKIELAARLEQSVRGGEHGGFVIHQIEDAVRDDDIERIRREVQLVELGDVALEKLDVGSGIAEALPVPVGVFARKIELLSRSVDADDQSVLAHALRQHVRILARAGTEIEHAHAFQAGRRDQTAAEIARLHLRVDVGERGSSSAGTEPPSQQAEVFRSSELFRTLP